VIGPCLSTSACTFSGCWSLSDHTIHLSDFAVRHFRALAAWREIDASKPGTATPWVFPGICGEGPVGVKSLGK
jgi:hypothetical protein